MFYSRGNRREKCRKKYGGLKFLFIFLIDAQKRIRRKVHSSSGDERERRRKHCQMPVVESHRQNRRHKPQKHEAAHKNASKWTKTGELSAWQPATPGGDQQPHKRPAQGRKPKGRNGPKKLAQKYTRAQNDESPETER